MLSRTRQAASRILTTTRLSILLTPPTPSLRSPSSLTVPRRPFHSSSHPTAAASSHSLSSSDHSAHSYVNPAVAKLLSDDVNGWFVGEAPGYKGDLLPGSDSRFDCALFGAGMVVLHVALWATYTYKRETDPNVWAKEYVLNVERYKVPDCPDPFPAQQ